MADFPLSASRPAWASRSLLLSVPMMAVACATFSSPSISWESLIKATESRYMFLRTWFLTVMLEFQPSCG